jgi:DNA-binding IclR family transcriptional regulator
MTAQGSSGVNALDNALDILQALTASGGAGVTELASQVDVSKSAVYKHLATLERRGYVVRDDDGTYDVGLRWLTVGGYARQRVASFHRVQRSTWEMADETGELVLFSTRVDDASMPLYHARGERAVTTDSYTGLALPLHCTATGKAILAALGDRREPILDRLAFAPHTANTITDREAFEADLERTARRGYSLEDEERIDGMRGIGVPVTNGRTGEVLGAFALTGPAHRIDGERFTESFPELLVNRAREVEINVTYESATHD